MAAKSLSYDDMHPRSFPSEKKQLVSRKIQALVPKPTLPGVSIIVNRNQIAKAAPKKSFIKWRQQHEALFEPKRFRTTNQNTGSVNERKVMMIPSHQTTTVASNAKFDTGFQKGVPSLHENQPKELECQQFGYDCDNFKNNFLAKNNHKPQFQSMMTFSQLNRVARSEATRFNVPLVGHHNSTDQMDDHQSNPCGCQCVASVTSDQIQSDELDNNQETELNSQTTEPSMELAVKGTGPVMKKALASIVEEQIEIVEQQKQILKQQNEIFNLQYRIEKLLLINNGLKNVSPVKQLQSSTNFKSITASPNVEPIENNGNFQSTPKARKSIGVMTSFHGNFNELCSPDGNHKVASTSENVSPKDTMLERINKIIQNSPPMVNYKLNNGNNNCRVSPLRTDINISSQTLIYKASTRNNISINDPKVADRSFALHLLDMKYHPEATTTTTPTSSNANRLNTPHRTIEKMKRSSTKYTDNDFTPSNISPDKYDYLIRHGLLKK